jgi:hypothetical protein
MHSRDDSDIVLPFVEVVLSRMSFNMVMLPMLTTCGKQIAVGYEHLQNLLVCLINYTSKLGGFK